jgi:hypothetical protein
VAYWKTDQVASNVLMTWGDGTTETVPVATTGTTTDYVTTTAIWNHTYPSYGSYVAFFSGCCRYVCNNVPSSDTSYIISCGVKLSGTYQVSPSLSNVGLVDMGIGQNEYAVVTTLPATFLQFTKLVWTIKLFELLFLSSNDLL